jgi:hypothetical protein
MPLSSMLKMFSGVSGRLFLVATFSGILKMFQQCSGLFFELELKKDVQQSYPAPSGSLWKLFEITMCLASHYALEGTVCVE